MARRENCTQDRSLEFFCRSLAAPQAQHAGKGSADRGRLWGLCWLLAYCSGLQLLKRILHTPELATRGVPSYESKGAGVSPQQCSCSKGLQ